VSLAIILMGLESIEPLVPMPRRLLLLVATLAGGTSVLVATGAAAQTVSGTVRAGGGAGPLPQTTIVLTTEDGTLVRGVVTGDDGAYTLRAPAPGRYRVKVRRIGFSPDSSAVLVLASGSSASFSPTLRPYATRLASMKVRATGSCVASGSAGGATVRLWNDVEAALTATAIATQPSGDTHLAFMLRRFARTVDPTTSLVLQQRSADLQTTDAYASLPAESLVREGFIRPGRDSTTYAAPDARTLASDAFVREHCFYATPGDSAHANDVGLGFRPVKRDRAEDVEGVLWVDTATAELRSLEYRYTGRFAAASLGLGGPSGRVDYARVGRGAWIVQHWVVRVPVAGQTVNLQAQDTSAKRSSHFVALYESGGDVLRTYLARGDSILPMPASVTGQVADSTRTPLGGARGVRVTLASRADSSPARTIVTDSTGAYEFDDVAPGDYVVRMASARFDTLGIAMPDRAVHVESGARAWLASAIPSLPTIVHGICAATGVRPGVVLHGAVTDPATHAPIPGAMVSVTWRDSTASGRTVGWTHVTDSTGTYVACGIPASDSLRMTVRVGDARYATTLLTMPHPVQRYDVASRDLANSASLLVSLVDAKGRAIPAGEVRLDSGAWVRGSAKAPIRLAGLAGGSHVLEARAEGGATHAWSVRLHTGRAVSTTLSLAPRGAKTELEAVRVVAAAPSRFEKHRASGMGHYIDASQIAARGYPSFIDLLRTVPGVRVVASQVDGSVSGSHWELEMRGANLLPSYLGGAGASPSYVNTMPDRVAMTGNRCPVVIYLDGAQVYFPKDVPTSDVLQSLVSTKEIAGIEVYNSSATIPTEYASRDAVCGVIAVWTGAKSDDGSRTDGGK